MVALGCLLLVAGAALPFAVAASNYTLPMSEDDYSAISSWLDHTSPQYGNDNNTSTMTRYDGTTGWSYNGHNGVDYVTGGKEEKFILAAAAGEVKERQWDDPNNPQKGYGYYIRVWHSTYGQSTLYAHATTSEHLVSVGNSVARSQRIALSGNTGTSTAPHLHFSVFAADASDTVGTTARDPYGWSGCSGCDPWPTASSTDDEPYLWTTNPPSLPPTPTAISPSTVTNYMDASIASVTGTYFRLGWDKETNLVGNWRMDETTGLTIADLSGSGNIATASGAATSTGKLANARNLDGVDDYISVPDSSSLSVTGDLSVALWFKKGSVNTSTAGTTEQIISKYNSQANDISFFLYQLDDAKLFFKVCQTGSCSTERKVESGAVSNTEWNHVAGVFKSGASGSIEIYLNGVDASATSTGSATSIYDSSTGVLLGAATGVSGSIGSHFEGKLDEARIYNRALYPSEVMELYKATAKGEVRLTKSGQSDIVCSGFTLNSYTTLTGGSCPVGGAATSTWNVKVILPKEAASDTLTNGLTINSSYPTVTSISPSSGSGTVSITSVGGTGFRPGWDKESGLLGNWRMDEASGSSVADSSGNGYTGTESGTATTTGKLVNARDLDATGDYVGFGDILDTSQTSTASIAFWWKGTPVSNRFVIMKEEPSGLYRGYSVFHYDFGSGVKLVWRIGQNDTGGKRTYCTTTTTAPGDGAWHHYAITQAGGTSCADNVNIYIDGVKETALTQYDSGAGAASASTANLYAGNGSGYGVSAVGAMDEFRIYNKALSPEEVTALYRVTGSGSIKLQKQGQSDITCTGFTQSSSTSMTSGSCNVTGAATGGWDVRLTNPDGENGALTSGFTVN